MTTPGLRLPAAIWLASGLLWFVLEGVAAAGYPGYDYATNYISDLGVTTVIMNVEFWLQGILFLIAAVLAVRVASGWMRWLFLVIAVAYAVGMFLIAVFPSSPEAHADGTILVHVIGANLAIVGGDAALIVAGLGSRPLGAATAFRIAAVAAGVLGLAAALALLLIDSTPGLWERAAVYPVMLASIVVGAVILLRRR